MPNFSRLLFSLSVQSEKSCLILASCCSVRLLGVHTKNKLGSPSVRQAEGEPNLVFSSAWTWNQSVRLCGLFVWLVCLACLFGLFVWLVCALSVSFALSVSVSLFVHASCFLQVERCSSQAIHFGYSPCGLSQVMRSQKKTDRLFNTIVARRQVVQHCHGQLVFDVTFFLAVHCSVCGRGTGAILYDTF